MQLGQPKRSPVHTLRFRLVDAWLTPLLGLAREVARLTRFNRAKLHLVPLGLPLEQFAPPIHTTFEARRELGLPQDVRLLGILGRLDAGKGLDSIINALFYLRQHYGYDVHLVIMGEPTRNEGDAFLQQLQRQVAQLGLQKQVHFQGFRANPGVFYHAIDVFILASENETYGMVTLEALAARVPIVGAAAGGTPEPVAHNHPGLLYPPGDVAACARAIFRTFAEPSATHARVERARLARWRYSHHRQCALTEEVIWGLVAVPVAGGHPAAPVAINAVFSS